MRSSLLLGLLGAAGIVLLTALTGNSDAIDPSALQDNAQVPAGEIAGAASIGQTFVPHHARLHSIQIRWIVYGDPQAQPAGRVILHVRGAGDSADLATASVPTGDIQNNAFTKFVFAPIPDSVGRSFYFCIDTSQAMIPQGAVSLWASGEDDYPGGEMMVNGLATRRDLVFRAYYEPDSPMLAQTLASLLAQYGIDVLTAIVIFVLPGFVLLYLLGRLDRAPPSVLIATGGGMGLAALSAGSILWLALGRIGLVALVTTASIAVLLVAARVFAPGWHRPERARPLPEPKSVYWTLGLLALLSLCIGLIQIRDLPVPLWVDSLTHAAYIQQIVQQGQLPANTFYHLGYHSAVALIAWLGRIPITQAMLVVGQLLITQAGLSVFALSRRLSGSGLAGLVGAACVWFLSPTPAYFVTWGRYPLLMGAALLPLALFSLVELLDDEKLHVPLVVLAVATFVGLAFAQVRLTVFYFAFAAVYALVILVGVPSPAGSRKLLLIRLGVVGLAAGVMGLLWLVALLGRGVTLASIVALNASAPSIDLPTAIAVSESHHGPELFLVSLLAAALGVVRRSKVAQIAVGWYIVVGFLSALPQNELGGEYVSPSLVVLMGFLPAALVVGDCVSALYARLTALGAETDRVPLLSVGAMSLSLVVLIGARDMASIVNPATILFSQADEAAMAWIKANEPKSSFLVNSSLWYGQAYTPCDGGGWIPYLTGGKITYLSSPMTLELESQGVAQWIRTRRVDYIYLGRCAGIWSHSDFTSEPDRYALVYDEDGIRILKVVRTARNSPIPNQAVGVSQPER